MPISAHLAGRITSVMLASDGGLSRLHQAYEV
jgi:hypothetical protein